MHERQVEYARSSPGAVLQRSERISDANTCLAYHPVRFVRLTNWLASSKFVIFMFFASHNNFFRPGYLPFASLIE